MMRSQSSLLYKYGLIVAGMEVDYYGWALDLGVGWQGWKQDYSTGLFISPSGTPELDCATTKKDTAERSISVGRESLKVFFLY